MKRLIPLLFLFTFISCTIQYDADERLVVTGKLVDKNNNPIPNNNVEVWVYADDPFLGDSSDLISFTATDSNGNFKMAFPKPKYENTIGVEFSNHNSEYQRKNFFNIHKTDFHNYRFDLNTVMLYKADDISNLKVILNRVNPSNEIQQIHLIGQIAEEYYSVNPVANEYFYYDDIYYNRVAKNQTITIEYDVLDRSTHQTTTMQQNIIIGADNNTDFTLDY